MNTYLLFKSLHLIAVVSWMAGLLYLPRIFVYHVENKEKKEAKIGSLGLRVRKGIIYHGLSLNVSCDLSNFYKIDPCGIKDSRVTSVKNLKNLVNKNEVDEVLKRKLKILFY